MSAWRTWHNNAHCHHLPLSQATSCLSRVTTPVTFFWLIQLSNSPTESQTKQKPEWLIALTTFISLSLLFHLCGSLLALQFLYRGMCHQCFFTDTCKSKLEYISAILDFFLKGYSPPFHSKWQHKTKSSKPYLFESRYIHRTSIYGKPLLCLTIHSSLLTKIVILFTGNMAASISPWLSLWCLLTTHKSNIFSFSVCFPKQILQIFPGKKKKKAGGERRSGTRPDQQAKAIFQQMVQQGTENTWQ